MGKGEGKGRGKGKGESINAPIWKMWSMLCPSFGTMVNKEPEMLGMVALNLFKAVELRMTTKVIKIMDATLASRNIVDFKNGLLYSVGVAVLSSWLRIIYGYLQARLTWKWKNKMTHNLHNMYFKGINYYLIGEGGGRGGDKLADADSRMTQDLNTVVNAFTKTFSETSFLLSTGVFYTYEIMREYDWKYAIAPYVYLGVAYIFVDVVYPVQKMIREIGRFRAESWGMYRFGLSRIDAQAESIASLKGASCEHKHIRECYAVHRFDVGYHHYIWAKFQVVNQFFMFLAVGATVILLHPPPRPY